MLANLHSSYVATLIVIMLGGVGLGLHYPRLASGHSVEERCPTIMIDCPTFGSVKDEPLMFTVTVSGAARDKKLEYKWAVSRGEIKTGQGTQSITVDVERNGASVSAKVEIKGLPEGCGGEASSYISHC